MATGDTVIAAVVIPPGCQLYVLAFAAVMVVDPPIQMAAELTLVVTFGNGFTTMVRVAVLVQPVAVVVPVTVYVVVAAGETVIATVVIPPGCQLYVLALLAVIVVEFPWQIVDWVAEVVVFGKGFTLMVRVAVVRQPVALVPVTVYVVVVIGDTTTEAPVIPPGIHK